MTTRLAFASDYDNTLFMHKTFRKGVSKKDEKAIREFQAAGGLFGVCTSRPYHGFFRDGVEKRIRFDFYIASTGAHIVDAKGNVLFSKTIPLDTAKEVISKCGRSDGHSVQVDGDFYLIGKYKRKSEPYLASLDDIRGRDLYEFSFRMKSEEAAGELSAMINENYGDVVCAFQNVMDIDVVAAGCSKGDGALFIKEHFSLSAIGGMGDFMNDLPLVEAADYGFTFPNAPKALREKADYLEKSVGDALKKFRVTIQ